MKMIKGYTSVVICTYNRAHLLKRSLKCYAKQTLKDFELIIQDDASTDNTEELVRSYEGKINVKYIKLDDKKPGEWRDAGAIVNRGIKRTCGEYIYITHPEVMPCFDCIEKLNKVLKENPKAYANSRTYYLTRKVHEKIDTVDWESDFYNIRKIEGFYDEDPLYKEKEMEMFNNLCTTKFAEIDPVWYSWVFGGMTRQAWKNFGGLNEFNEWGSVDLDFMERRLKEGIITISPKDVYIVHQNHDKPVGEFEPTKRTFNHAFQVAAKRYNDKKDFLADMEM